AELGFGVPGRGKDSGVQKLSEAVFCKPAFFAKIKFLHSGLINAELGFGVPGKGKITDLFFSIHLHR
ncbi:MAG: hypothetical protein BWK80_55080, partial [Desulfobacteraceae bacterium IS3]